MRVFTLYLPRELLFTWKTVNGIPKGCLEGTERHFPSFLHSWSHLCDSRIRKALSLFFSHPCLLSWPLCILSRWQLAVLKPEVLISALSGRSLAAMHHSIESGHTRGWKYSFLSQIENNTLLLSKFPAMIDGQVFRNICPAHQVKLTWV